MVLKLQETLQLKNGLTKRKRTEHCIVQLSLSRDILENSWIWKSNICILWKRMDKVG